MTPEALCSPHPRLAPHPQPATPEPRPAQPYAPHARTRLHPPGPCGRGHLSFPSLHLPDLVLSPLEGSASFLRSSTFGDAPHPGGLSRSLLPGPSAYTTAPCPPPLSLTPLTPFQRNSLKFKPSPWSPGSLGTQAMITQLPG